MSKNIYNQLIQEIRENREELKASIKEISKFKNVLDKIFPEKIDLRNKFIIEERIKTTVEFHNVLLKYRQELNKMIKDEFELRRKLDKSEEEKDLLDKIDLEKLKQLEKMIQEETKNDRRNKE